MKHLHDSEFVDWLDGTLPRERVAHLDACTACLSQAEALTTALAMVESDPPRDPSPLFWERLPARVNERIDAQSPASRWFTLPRLAFAAAGALCAALLAFNLLTPVPVSRDTGPARTAADAPALPVADDLDADLEWAVVRAAADDLDFDDAHAEGLAAHQGTIERVVMELTEEERAELVRLVETELKHGA